MAAIVLAGGIGAVHIPANVVAELLLDRLPLVELAGITPGTASVILFDIRMPRIVLMALTGSYLAAAGAAYQ